MTSAGSLLTRAAVPALLCTLLAACGSSSPGASIAGQEQRSGPVTQALAAYVWYAGSGHAASEEELEVLRLTNKARAQGITCGATATEPAKNFPPVPELKWNDDLAHAARNHVQDMAVRGYFSHYTPENVGEAERATLAGYDWQTVGENIAAGASKYGSAAAVVGGWLGSPGHCRNLMNANFREMGAGVFRAEDSADKYGTYWGQVFGAR